MSSQAQLDANRANAQRSTGPKSEAGKAASAQHSTRHGFRSQTVLLPGDDPAEYTQLLEELNQHFNPADLTETRCVREMADAEWRLRRVRQYVEVTLTRKIEELAIAHLDKDPIELQAMAHEQLGETPPGTPLNIPAENSAPANKLQNGTNEPNPEANETRNGTNDAKSTASSTPRNAACPCGSGQKYKRCCGRGAPPVLFPAASRSNGRH